MKMPLNFGLKRNKKDYPLKHAPIIGACFLNCLKNIWIRTGKIWWVP
jgi:hypothetical protein